MGSELAKELREAGFEKEASMIESVTPEQEAEFEVWLEVPENRAKWDKAVEKARSLSQSTPEGEG